MKIPRWLLPILIGILLVGGAFAWQSGRSRQAAGENSTVTQFQALLERAGLQVEKTAQTNTYSMFGLKPGSSTGFWTDQGVLDVVFFSERIEGRLRIEEVGGYNWQIHGWRPDPLDPLHFGSNRPQYFIIHRNLFIMTDTPSLAESVKAALQ